MNKKLGVCLQILILFLFIAGCSEDAEQNVVIEDEPKLIEGTRNVDEQEEVSVEVDVHDKTLEKAKKEIENREDLEIVENVDDCKREDIFCFNYAVDSGLIVKMELDDKQKEFYDLIKNYELPEAPEEGIEPQGYSNILFYENGYAFFIDSKHLFRAPYESFDVVEPTKEQYFGILMTRVRSIGQYEFEYEHIEPGMSKTKYNQYKIETINETKKFTDNDVVINWLDDCAAVIQTIIDSEMNSDEPSEELYLKARKKLSYIGDISLIYEYEYGPFDWN
ncbi:hypothetical protein ACOQFO_07945 [Ureibacillus sp. MALMAid1270]|uniref:hypothetical protein n=1 Tax=Ureibacillus sp. MALMAid1270 TaxID=3411629 RepID=UPI003BA45DE0